MKNNKRHIITILVVSIAVLSVVAMCVFQVETNAIFTSEVVVAESLDKQPTAYNVEDRKGVLVDDKDSEF